MVSNYSHLSNKRDIMLTNFGKFHSAQNKNSPCTFIDCITKLSIFLQKLIKMTPRLPTSENSSLHKTKIHPARLLISLQNFQYSYRTFNILTRPNDDISHGHFGPSIFILAQKLTEKVQLILQLFTPTCLFQPT